MKIIKLAATAGFCVAVFSSNLVWAEESSYFGVNYEAWSVKDDSGEDLGIGKVTWSPSLLTVKAGINLNESFAIEGKLGLGAGDSSKTVNFSGYQTKMTVDPKYSFGVYGVGKIPFNEEFELYGKLGLTHFAFDLKASVTGYGEIVNETESETKASIGAGANFFLDENNGINIEWMAPSIGDLGDINTFSVGYIRKF